MINNFNLSRLIIMCMTIALLIGISSITYAIEFPSVGFYVNGKDENIYFDVYTFLNKQDLCMEKINEAGLENIIFIHQSGKANTLQKILEEYGFRDLKYLDFEGIYNELLTEDKIHTGFDVFRVVDIY